MKSIETQTEEEYTVIEDKTYYAVINKLKIRNNICIFYGNPRVIGNTQSTMTQYNSDNEYYMNSFIQQLKDSGDF